MLYMYGNQQCITQQHISFQGKCKKVDIMRYAMTS